MTVHHSRYRFDVSKGDTVSMICSLHGCHIQPDDQIVDVRDAIYYGRTQDTASWTLLLHKFYRIIVPKHTVTQPIISIIKLHVSYNMQTTTSCNVLKKFNLLLV